MSNPIPPKIDIPPIGAPLQLSPLSRKSSTPKSPVIQDTISSEKTPSISLKDRLIQAISSTNPTMAISAGLGVGIILTACLGAVSLGIGIPIGVICLLFFIGQVLKKEPSSKDAETAIQAANCPVGFPNLGNTCFANSVLKTILHTPNFDHDLNKTLIQFPGFPRQVGEEIRMVNPESEEKFLQRVTLQADLKDLKEAYLSKNKSLIKERLRSIFSNPIFRDRNLRITRSQEDAHEFLTVIFEALEVTKNPRSTINFQDRVDIYSDEGHLIVSDPLGQEDSHSIISLKGSFKESTSLNRLISSHLNYELDDGRKVKKELSTPENAPVSSICLQLPRFKKIATGGRTRVIKQNGTINHLMNPSSIAIQLKTATGTSTPSQLELLPKSFVCHEGNSINSGHYFTYVREEDGSWYKHNDSITTKVTQKEVETVAAKKAYLAFYDTAIRPPVTG